MPAGDNDGGKAAESMPNLMPSINPNLNLTPPGEEDGGDGGRRKRRRLQDKDGEGERVKEWRGMQRIVSWLMKRMV